MVVQGGAKISKCRVRRLDWSFRFALAFLIAAAVGLASCSAESLGAGGGEVALVAQGRALFPVSYDSAGGGAVEELAGVLARKLGQMGGCQFEVQPVDSSSKLILRVDPQLNALGLDYRIAIHQRRLEISGVSPTGLENAIWEFLFQLGYRQYFPGPTWEIVPQSESLTTSFEEDGKPDYRIRNIWPHYGAWKSNRARLEDWKRKNRLLSPERLNTGHANIHVINRNRELFEANPEFFSLVNGKRDPQLKKFCLSNPDLIELIVEDARAFFEKRPEQTSYSVDPSDGGGWCQCAPCQALGSPSDQVVWCANRVAEKLQEAGRTRKVAFYAYNFHSRPPSVEVGPDVVVSVATKFIKGGYSPNELAQAWSSKGAVLGIRDYFSVIAWDKDLPSQALASKSRELSKVIPKFHRLGARYYSAESGDNWGPNGFGYFFASRLLWDVSEAEKLEAYRDEFLRNCFPGAEKPMKEFYDAMDGDQEHLSSELQIGRMFGALERAYQAKPEAKVRMRLDALLAYARYVGLFHEYEISKGESRQRFFAQIIQHSYRIRGTHMTHSLAAYRDLERRDKRVAIPSGNHWQVKEEENSWKSSEPVTEAEFESWLSWGLERFTLRQIPFSRASYSDALMPVNLEPPEAVGAKFPRARGEREWWIYVKDARRPLEFLVTGGLIKHFRDRGPVRLELLSVDGEIVLDRAQPVEPDGNQRRVQLRAEAPGLYRVRVRDGRDASLVEFPSEVHVTFQMTSQNKLETVGRWGLYFYVPRGVRAVGFFGGMGGEFFDSKGTMRFSMRGLPKKFYSIPVPEGEDGKVWSVRRARFPIRLLTVPDFWFENPRAILPADAP